MPRRYVAFRSVRLRSRPKLRKYAAFAERKATLLLDTLTSRALPTTMNLVRLGKGERKQSGVGNMPIKVECPQCKKSLNAPHGATGRTATCPKCKGQIRIPGTPVPKATLPHDTVPRAQSAATPAVSKANPVGKAGVPVAAVAATAAPKPLIAKALPSKSESKAARHSAPPAIEELPALDSLSNADPFAGLSIEALGGDPLAGAALSASPLAAMPAKRRNIDLLPVMVIAGAVLVVCLLGGGLYLLMRGGITGGGASADWLKFMPQNSEMIVHVDVQKVRASGILEKLKQFNPAIDEQIQQGLRGTSLRLEDIDTVSVGGSFQAGENFVAVVRMNRSVSEAEMRSAKSTRQETVGPYTLHYEGRYAGARIDDHTIVSGTPRLVEAVIARNGPARLSSLQSAVDDADFSSDFTMVMTVAGLPGMNRTVPGAPVDPSQIESVALSADLGSSIELEASVYFKDSGTASDIKDKIDQQMSMMKAMMGNLPPQAQEFQSVLDSLSISRSGRRLVAEVTLAESIIDSATKSIEAAKAAAAARGRGTPPNGNAQSPQQPERNPNRGKTFRQDPNLPATAPSRGLF
jgi:hypothetical protein